MALTVLILACLLSYTTSRYFPKHNVTWVKENRVIVQVLANGLLLLSLWLLTFDYNGAAAFIIWLIAWMTVLSALILTTKLSLKWLYLWGMVSVLLLIIDIF
ncbi:MAG: hypothetical protein AAF734_05465 [Bacteroidota bacterium]